MEENIKTTNDKRNEKIQKKLKGKVKKRNVFIVILILIIILLLLVILRGFGGDTLARYIPWISVSDDFIAIEEADRSSCDIPLITDFSVSGSKPTIPLFNPDTNKNKFYILYKFYLRHGNDDSSLSECEVTETDELIYTSNTIEPAGSIDVNVKDLLPRGRHNLLVKVEVYHAETLELDDSNLVTPVQCYVRR